jgi:hypothetical protein
MLTYADVCRRMLTYADVCRRMLTYADVADVCRRMLTDADVYGQSEEFEESNYDRLVRKWGGKAEFEVLNLLALLVQSTNTYAAHLTGPKKTARPQGARSRGVVSFFPLFFSPPFCFSYVS